MMKLNYLLSTILIVAVGLSSQAGNEKKFDRTMERADAFYADFSYKKAIGLYEKALEYKDDQTPKLQLANCYRKLNQPDKALDWYKKALVDGPISKEDMLHYGQVLSTMQQYDSAHVVLNEYQHLEEWAGDRAEGFKHLDIFFHNEIAYIINESIFNSTEADFSPSFTEKGVMFVTGRPFKGMLKPRYDSDETYFLNLFEVMKGEAPRQLERGINTRFHEGPSILYSDFTKMIFTRNNYLSHRHGESKSGVMHLKLYLTELQDGEWTKPVEFPYNSDEYSIGHPTLSTDEQTLYFASDMPGGFGGVDLYKSRWVNGQWGQPENMGERFNTARDETFPYLSNDSFLYFASDGHEGLGGLDIFRVDMLRDNSYPRNMGFSMNTHKDDFGIVLDKNGNKGYFSSNREGGTGDDDIYELFIFDYIIKVNLRDAETKELISGKVESTDIYMNEIVRIDSTTISFPAIRGDVFHVKGMAPEYLPDSLVIETAEKSRDIRRLEYDIYLKKPIRHRATIYRIAINGRWEQVMYAIEDTLSIYAGTYDSLLSTLKEDRIAVDSVVDLQNVLFDFDKHDIRKDAGEELDKWVTFLNRYPDEHISLSAHTDIRGSNRYNERLAKRRVKSTAKYLMKAGISQERFVERDFGEEQLWENCAKENCSEAQHQNNRRTEILVKKN